MKKTIFSFILCALLLVPAQAAQVQNFDIEVNTTVNVTQTIQYEEQIDSFTTGILIKKDGSIKVEETIAYDFGKQNRHGIFRNIPYTITNSDGKQYAMDMLVLSVSDENGVPYKYDVSTSDGEVVVKIGDPDVEISGKHTYKISYDVKGALRYFSDHDELYWNVTGNNWGVPMQKASALVISEFPNDLQQANIVCYTGEQGSTARNCQTVLDRGDGGFEVSTSEMLYPLQGLTFAYRFPKGQVAVLEPKEVINFWDTIQGKITLVLIILACLWWYLGYPIWLGIKWFLFGRDPDVGKPVTAWFDPPVTKSGRPLTPAETGAILDEKVEMKDMAGMMVDLARRGYYTITETKENDFTLTKKKDKDDTLQPFEKDFLTVLFTTKSSVRIKDAKLASSVSKITSDIYKDLTTEGYFPENPQSVRTFYGVLMGLAGMTFNFPLLIAGTLFGLNMVRKTVHGAKASQVAKGMQNFLKSQERQLQYQGDKQLLFEKLLPFAVAFGVERQWTERFKDINLHEPEWFHSATSGGHFNSTYFSNSLHSSVNSFASAATPVSSSTGSSSGFSGGSSGGGGGGGGGGSW